MKYRNVLITGGAGYIGSHVAEKLVKENIRVVCLDNLSKSRNFQFDGSTNIKGDISDLNLLSDIFTKYNFDAVIHLAAHAYVGESMHKPQDYYLNNVSNSLQLFEVMNRANVRNIVFASSCAIYGEALYLPMDENHPKEPINPYGRSKKYIEEILMDYHKPYKFSSITLRFFNVSGCGENIDLLENHEPETHIIPLILKHAFHKKNKKATKQIEIFGGDFETRDGTPIRDFIHVVDLANAIYLATIKLLSCENSFFTYYNIANEQGFSVREIIQFTETISGEKIDFTISDRKTGDPAILVGTSAKIKKELGWHPFNSSLEKIIQSSWAALNG